MPIAADEDIAGDLEEVSFHILHRLPVGPRLKAQEDFLDQVVSIVGSSPSAEEAPQAGPVVSHPCGNVRLSDGRILPFALRRLSHATNLRGVCAASRRAFPTPCRAANEDALYVYRRAKPPKGGIGAAVFFAERRSLQAAFGPRAAAADPRFRASHPRLNGFCAPTGSRSAYVLQREARDVGWA